MDKEEKKEEENIFLEKQANWLYSQITDNSHGLGCFD